MEEILKLRLEERGIEAHIDESQPGRLRLWLTLADAQRLADALAPAELPEAAREVLRTVAGFDTETALPCRVSGSAPRADCDCWACLFALEARDALGVAVVSAPDRVSHRGHRAGHSSTGQKRTRPAGR